MLAIGCDHGGFALKRYLTDYLKGRGIAYKDFGTNSTDAFDYPDSALPLAEAVASGECDRGILICGTGIGMSIAANKVRGIRAAVCHDVFSAKATREHNDANILCCGERVIGPGLFLEVVAAFLDTEFSNSERHICRIGKITAIENKYFK